MVLKNTRKSSAILGKQQPSLKYTPRPLNWLDFGEAYEIQ